jgi:hypothetical protein
MQVIVLTAEWNYEKDSHLVGVFTWDRLEEAKKEYLDKFPWCVRNMCTFSEDTVEINKVN